MSKKTHYRETKYGFQFGQADVSRAISDKGMVVIRIASRTTGKIIDVQVSAGGRTMHTTTGQYLSPKDVPGEQE